MQLYNSIKIFIIEVVQDRQDIMATGTKCQTSW